MDSSEKLINTVDTTHTDTHTHTQVEGSVDAFKPSIGLHGIYGSCLMISYFLVLFISKNLSPNPRFI